MAKLNNNEDDDFEAREERLRINLVQQAERAIELRSKDRQFHGLEREFRYHQAQMIVDFSKSKDVKHPRDVGNIREQILRKFLRSSGYLPKRYAVSERSIRIASPTGHLSNEIDIALYDAEDSISLMNREDIFEVLPVESVYGVIQVKSRLNREEIRNGLANLASFKRLDRRGTDRDGIIFGAPEEKRGFGILFAFDSDLKWKEIIEELEAFAGSNPKREWANAILILSKGFFLYGTSKRGSCINSHIEAIDALQMFGMPDRDGSSLYQFYDILSTLLRQTEIQPASWAPYYRLPLVADELSYSFAMGQFAEIGHCELHGHYARKIEPDKLKKVVTWCLTTTPINWIKAYNIAYGLPDDEAAYLRQPGDVYIYNPDNVPLPEVLLRDDHFQGVEVKSLAYERIISQNIEIWIPYHYVISELIISICPKCMADIVKKAGRSAQPRSPRRKKPKAVAK
jgi:hypothetical protein